MATHVQTLLQARIYAILTGDATLLALLATSSSVYDAVPDRAAFPYITFGEAVLEDWGSHTHDGFQGTITIHAWAQGADVGRKKAQAILNRLYAILHNVDLAVSGFPTISNRCVFNEVVPDPSDARTYHGIQRYRLILGG